MNSGIVYDASGQIVKIVRVTNPGDLQANVGAGESCLIVAVDAENIQRRRIDDGVITEKAKVIISGPATFQADGVSIGQLSFAGLQADIQVRVNSNSVTVTEVDPILALTSDVPKSFQVEVKDGLHWSEVFTVKAI